MLGLGNTLMGGAPPSEFTAASISSLDLWYDFSTVTGSNGDAVSSFANAGAGGSNYDLSQGTGSLQPNLDTSELGLNSLDFDDDRFDLANAYLTTDKTFTFFCVFEMDAMSTSAGVDTLFGGSSGDANMIGIYNNRNVTTRFNAGETSSLNTIEYVKNSLSTQDPQYTGSATSTTAYEWTADPEIIVLTRAADNEIRIYNKDGDLIGLSTSYTNNHADTNFQVDTVGMLSGGGSNANGCIGEMGLYNKTLSASEVSSLITHLAAKWSVT